MIWWVVTAVFLHFPDPETAPFPRFMDRQSITSFMLAGSKIGETEGPLPKNGHHHPLITRFYPTSGGVSPRSFPLEITIGRPSFGQFRLG